MTETKKEKTTHTLTVAELEAIAERGAILALDKMTTHLFIYVGRNILEKFFWYAGVAVIALYFWLDSRGLFK